MLRRSSLLLLLSYISTALQPTAGFAQSGLPASVRADLLQNQINEAVRAGDFGKALSAFDQYKALGVVVPPALMYLEAKASTAANSLARAKRALEMYLQVKDVQSDPNYKDALTLYASVLPAAEAIIAKEREQIARSQKDAAAAYSQALACEGCPDMAVVPAGSYEVLAPVNIGITLTKPFALAKYEVTFDEWDMCFKDGGCKYNPPDKEWGRGKRPVIGLSWYDAQEYAAWLSKRTGQSFRLPSEAEWEIAARAGSVTSFPWGEDRDPAKMNCNDCGNEFDRRTAPVGTFPPNAWGFYDMHSNAPEWVEDCSHNSFGLPSDGRAWTENCAEGRRMFRGGHINGQWSYRASSFRGAEQPANRWWEIGLRLARDLS